MLVTAAVNILPQAVLWQMCLASV